MSHESCPVCDEIAGRVAAPGGVIFENEWWIVQHHTGPWTDPGDAGMQLGLMIINARTSTSP